MAVVDPSTNYSWELPNVAGDSGNWGSMLRTIIADTVTGIDAVLKAVSDVANAALPKAGGSMTGEIDVLTERFLGVNKGNMSGAVSFDLDAGNCFYGTVNGNISGITFSNVPATGDFVFVTLELTNPGAFTIAWGGIRWPGGSPPTLTTSGVDVVTLYTRDGGTTWNAAVAMLALS